MYSGTLGLSADVVAIIKSHSAHSLQCQHGRDVPPHGLERTLGVLRWIGSSQRQRLGQRHSIGHIAAQSIVRAGLVGQNVGCNAAPGQFRGFRLLGQAQEVAVEGARPVLLARRHGGLDVIDGLKGHSSAPSRRP